jgi:transcription elongation factor GreA
VNSAKQNPSLGEAANLFLSGLSPEERVLSQQEVHKFVRWFGWKRSISGLTAAEVTKYAESLPSSDTDHTKKVEQLRAFLAYIRKKGWNDTNLATHLKAKKVRPGSRPLAKPDRPEPIALTAQRHAEMKAELNALRSKRLQVIDEMHKAAADKDFRENAPLQAAREQRGHLEGRIRELEDALKAVTIIGKRPATVAKASIGDSIILRDLDSGDEQYYIIVSPKEVDPAQGKISSASPIGKAVIGRSFGEVVEVATPAGKLRYEIKKATAA